MRKDEEKCSRWLYRRCRDWVTAQKKVCPLNGFSIDIPAEQGLCRNRGLLQPSLRPLPLPILHDFSRDQATTRVDTQGNFLRTNWTESHQISRVRTFSNWNHEPLWPFLQSLSNLFNALPRTSPLRLLVYQTILDTASSNDELDFLQLSRADVNHWLDEWEITPSEKSAFLKSIADAYAKFDQLYVSFQILF